jgi:dipeptidyl aminopeptidase/acylaminoacyl peptidase
VEPSETAHFIRSFLSDGRRFLFMDMQVPRNVYVGSLDDPNVKHRLNVGSTASPVRDLIASRGHLIYTQKGAVVAQVFDEESLELRGAPIRLAETDGTPWQPRPSVSRTGTLVFRSTGDAIRQLTWRDRDGNLLGVVGRPGLDTQVELSPTDARAILVRGGPWPEDRDLWLADLTTNNVSILTARPGLDADAVWSPNEKHIAYSSSQDGMVSPVVKNLDTGNEERLIKTSERVVVDDWTGDSLVVRKGAVFTLPVEGERKLRPLAVTPYSRDQLQVSSDGRSIAFNADESTVWEVYVARFMQNFPGKRQVSHSGGVQPRWRRDGLELYYLAPDGWMMVVQRADVETLNFGAAKKLFKTPLNPAAPEWSEYDVTSDGKRFLILEPTAAAPPAFTFIENWSDGQK